jgi:hypothetical protein
MLDYYVLSVDRQHSQLECIAILHLFGQFCSVKQVV